MKKIIISIIIALSFILIGILCFILKSLLIRTFGYNSAVISVIGLFIIIVGIGIGLYFWFDYKEKPIWDKSTKIIKSTDEKKLGSCTKEIDETHFNILKDFIINQLKIYSKRGIICLTIGVCTTVLSIAILTFSLFEIRSLNIQSYLNFIVYFIPRLTFILLIETFSFFFLRLYRRYLDEIKYLNNEITNITLKFIALNSSQKIDNDEVKKFVIKEFAKTERNYIIKKGESTIEIESDKWNNNSVIKIIEILSKFRTPDLS